MADNMNRFKTQYDISKSGQTALEKINNDLSIRNHYLITEN